MEAATPLDASCAQQLVSTVMTLRSVYNALFAPFGLTTVQWHVLRRLMRGGPMSQAELGRQMQRDKANITRIIDGLAGRGWVRRQADPDDRRKRYIVLSPNGRRRFEACLRPYERFTRHLEKSLGTQERAALHRIAAKLRRNAAGFAAKEFPVRKEG